jgi:hypothetical protein
MRIPLVGAPVGLAISFALPTFAQQKDTAADPQTTEKGSRPNGLPRHRQRFAARRSGSKRRITGATVAGKLNLSAAYLGIALGLLFATALSEAQQADLDAAAAAKARAGREALIHAPIDSQAPKAVGIFITFDAPGAGTGFFQGTFPASINPAGAITGNSVDVNLVAHGFLRSSNGTFTTFDAPGAGTGFFQGTFPASINPTGAITGYSWDANNVAHGFLRSNNGTFTTFNAPRAVIGTFPASINPAGAITGYSWDTNFVGHGFLRATNGILTTFDVPGAGTTGFPQGTYAASINPGGQIAGMYTDANNVGHGFLQATNGTLSTFDAPGSIAISPPFSFGPSLYINPDGGDHRNLQRTYFGKPLRGQLPCLCADSRRHPNHIRCGDLSPLLYMVVPLRY